MIAKRIFLASTFAAIVAISATVAQAQSTDKEQSANPPAAQGGGILDVLEQIKQAQARQLEGSWVITVTPAVPPGASQPQSFRAYATVARGGAYIGPTLADSRITEAQNPIPTFQEAQIKEVRKCIAQSNSR